jgi:hypothetical protein
MNEQVAVPPAFVHDLADNALHINVSAYALCARKSLLPLHGDCISSIGC